MKRRIVLGSVAALVAGLALMTSIGGTSAQEGPAVPLASGLSTTGSTIGPDGALYVPLPGTGGDEELTLDPDIAAEVGADKAYVGLTGSVVRIDPATGAQTTYADEIPSIAIGQAGPGEGTGATDVTFMGDTLYVLTTGSADVLGKPEYPNAIYELQSDGSWDLFANISEYNLDNPADFPDAIPGGNPFAIETRGTGFVVADGNANRLLLVSSTGDISLIAQFDNVVPTGLEVPDDTGPVWNTWFSPEPHTADASFLQEVAVPGGAVTTVADGWAMMIDVEQTDDGAVYVLQFAGESSDPDAEPPPGTLLRLADDGTLQPVVAGLPVATSLSFSGDTAFITSLTGQVWRVDNVNDLPVIAPVEPTPVPPTPAPPAPTPTAGGVITAPDTGTGPAGEAGGLNGWLVAMVAAGAALALAGTAVARSRR